MPRLFLPHYAAALVEQVRERSGHPIALVNADAVGYDSQLRIARDGADRHEVAVVPEYRAFALHFLVSAARKVLRLYDAPLEERVMPAYEAGRRLPEDQEDELRRNFRGHLDEDGVRVVSQFLFAGAVQQLTSFPIDLRVEREIYDELHEHRPLQLAYLRRQVADLEPHFTAEIEGPAPKRSYAATSAMNIALAEEASEIVRTPIGSLVRSSPHRAMGKRLREILREEKAPGYGGDLHVTDAWAEELGMRDWYGWAPNSD